MIHCSFRFFSYQNKPCASQLCQLTKLLRNPYAGEPPLVRHELWKSYPYHQVVSPLTVLDSASFSKLPEPCRIMRCLLSAVNTSSSSFCSLLLFLLFSSSLAFCSFHFVSSSSFCFFLSDICCLLISTARLSSSKCCLYRAHAE
jgi:hypothetical protein